jgi:predicted XRE-type DNA-binding protein
MPTFIDCIVADGGYPTQDGYIRVLTEQRKDGGKLKMLHRLEWEKLRGSIPEGYTIHHRCKNRQCQNINHLELLPHSDHATEDNRQRYLENTVKVLRWISTHPGLKPKEVAEGLGVKRHYVERLAREYPEIRQHLKMKEVRRNGKETKQRTQAYDQSPQHPY